MNVLVTGAAGFIGFHVCRRLLATKRCTVVGVDNLNDYYSVDLKRARLAELDKLTEGLAGAPKFRFVQMDFADTEKFAALYQATKPAYVVHLGAQAGVRHSMERPELFAHSNIQGFLSVLEACRARPPKHLVFASSSSVYGSGSTAPYSEDQPADRPVSFYGATKRANELMAHSYAHLHGLNITGLRFFTVYGPWGRPDMAPMIFSKAILEGSPLRLFNHGKSLRDFTYVDDIVDGVLKVLLYPPVERASPPYRIFNLGHNRPVEVLLFVRMLEELLGKKAAVELLPPQPGDMLETCASLERVHAAIGYRPRVTLEDGLRQFVDWFKVHYGS